MEAISNRIERTIGITLPTRIVHSPCSFLLRGLLSLSLHLSFEFTVFKKANSILCFCVVEKIGKFPHLYHLNEGPCHTHVRTILYLSFFFFFFFPSQCVFLTES